MDVKKVLWPTDFSENAKLALPWVNSLTEKYGAEVYLLHVAEDLSAYGHYWGSGPDFEHMVKLQDHSCTLAEKRLHDLCANALGGCPRYHFKVLIGDPAKEILRYAAEIGADVVVMATHGAKAHFPFGSVTEKVVKNSPVPVLTVGPKK